MSYLHNQPTFQPLAIACPIAFLIGLNELGVHETAGSGTTPRVGEYLATCKDLSKADRVLDETPWCSAFRNWCELTAGGVGTYSAGARSWLTWGKEVPSLTHALPGDTLVFRRDGGHHVGFFTGVLLASKNRVRVLGGNQTGEGGGAVTLGSYSVDDLLAVRRAW